MTPFTQDCLKGKVALITGGGSGICKEIALYYLRHGAAVCIVSRTQQKLSDAKTDLIKATSNSQVLAIAADVRKLDQIQAAFEGCAAAFGKIDVVICGAAGNFLCPARDLSVNAFKTVLEIDLLGTFITTKVAYPFLCKTKGQIITISMTLHYTGSPMQIHASAAKAGIDALTRSLAVEWGLDGIRVNCIAPGVIAGTVGIDKLLPKEFETELREKIPLQRFGTTSDIAHSAVFLATDAASYINGAFLVVDGGAWMTAQSNFYPAMLSKL